MTEHDLQSADRRNDNWLERGSSGSTADLAVEGAPDLQGRSETAPFARAAAPLAQGELFDQLADKVAVVGDRQEAIIDEAIEESFPASDPPHPKSIS